jgi:hypothetical protein
MGAGELVDQASLARPGLPNDRHDLAVAGASALQGLAQGLELRLPPDKTGEPAGRKRLEARPGGGSADELEHLHRVRQALDRDGTQCFHLHDPFGQPQGFPRGEHRARLGHLLQTRGQVGGLAYRCVVHVQAAVNRPHHHFPSIEPDADLHRHPMGALHRVAVVGHGFLHSQRGVARPHRMVLMGNGCPKQRHDAIAHHLVHGAFVAVHRLYHPFEDRVQQLPGLFRITVRE